jgi:hypothetical protein
MNGPWLECVAKQTLPSIVNGRKSPESATHALGQMPSRYDCTRYVL